VFRKTGGVILLCVAAFMLLGFLLSGQSLFAPATFFGFLVAVLLPAVTGGFLLKPAAAPRGRLPHNREQIRQRTLQSEVLRLAGERQGRLTIVEVVEQFAVTPEEAKTALDALALEGMADFAVTDSGMVVYDFPELRQLEDKSKAKGILDD
jgi:hypothetical protein